MTVEEIFTKILSHMKEGIQYHQDIAKAFEFLGLWGYAHCHDSHEFEETCNYKQFHHYYMTHYFKLLQLTPIKNSTIIPEQWYKYTSYAVDINTRRTAIKDLMNKWIEWEKSTKKLYQEMRQELTIINDLDAALELDKYIRDVSKELSHAQKKLLTLESHNYDMTIIIDESSSMLEKYRKKLGW